MEERQPPGVLGHEREARAVDDLAHAQARRETLGELRLAGAQRPDQRDSVAGASNSRQRGGEIARLVAGVSRHGRARGRSAGAQLGHTATLPIFRKCLLNQAS